MRTNGFVPYPFDAPQSYSRLDLVIQSEAKRLLGIARDFVDRRMAADAGPVPADRARRLERMRADFRLDELAAVVEGPSVAAPAGDPVVAAIEAHRSTHAAWLASLERDDEAETAAAMGRKDAAFTTLLAMQPLSEAGRLAYAAQVLFEFAHAAIGSVVPPEWMRIAGRMMNRGRPIVTASQAPSAFGHAAGEAALKALEDALAPHLALPAPGSPEALARFKAASRAVDHAACLGEGEDRALHIGEGFTYWTSDRVQAAQLGDWSRFSIGELEVARTRTKAGLDELMVLALRRELRMAEAVRDTHIRELYTLAFPETGAEAGAAPAADAAEPTATSLTAAAAELIRLDRAIEERLGVEEKARDEAWQAGVDALEKARDTIIETLNETPSRTLADLQAKARALRTRELTEDFEGHGDLALSLAEDIERLTGSGGFAPEPAQAFPLAAE